MGRHQEVSEIKRLLSTARSVTLTGVAGVGKTRLALHTARALRRTFPNGVWFVDLAVVSDSTLVPETVVTALGVDRSPGVDPLSVLVDRLRDWHMLLVLDNCEHLLDACAKLAAAVLLTAAKVQILATSREALGVYGEQVMSVAPLPVPPLSTPDCGVPHSLRAYDGIALFEERARTVVANFTLTDDNYPMVARLCHQLEGLPLAIELAVTRLRVLELGEVEQRLDDRFRLLTAVRRRGDRHQSLQAAVEWSYDLCTPAERLVWARASVFAGGFDLEAAEFVCAGEDVPAGMVWERVASLVEKSILLVGQVAGHRQYRLLETLRSYGQERLHETDEGALAQRRHRDWFLRLAERFEAEATGPRQLDWLRVLPSHHANLRAALEFCATQPQEGQAGLRMMSALWFYWLGRSLHTEARHWLGLLLQAAPESTAERVEALSWATFFAYHKGDLAAVRLNAEECALLAAQHDDDYLRGRAAHAKGYLALRESDYAQAERSFAQAADSYQARATARGVLILACGVCALTATVQGAHERAEEWIDLARTTAEEGGERYCFCSHVLYALATTKWASGAVDEAAAHARESLRVQHGQHDMRAVLTIEMLSRTAASTGEFERAAVLMGAVDHLDRVFSLRVLRIGAIAEPRSACVARTREALGGRAFEAAFSRGQELDYDQAVAYAFGEPPPSTAEAANDAVLAEPESPLTYRERQVAQLVAEGMSNKQIAAKLVVAQRTAEGHVERIMQKLGFTKRTQIATWVVTQGSSSPNRGVHAPGPVR